MPKRRTPFRESIHLLLQRKTIIVSIAWLVLMIAVALLASMLANDKPLYFSYNNQTRFPIFSGRDEIIFKDPRTGNDIAYRYDDLPGKIKNNATIIYAPVRYSPHKSDMENTGYVGPFDQQLRLEDNSIVELSGLERHLLGTGRRGDDVLSGIIHGTRISMSVGFFSMAIAGAIGIILGSMAGYFGDNQLKLSRGQSLSTLIGILPAWFYGFQLNMIHFEAALRNSSLAFIWELIFSTGVFLLTLILFNKSGKLLRIFPWFAKETYVRIDSIISRFIEVLISLPRLILIITIAAISKPSLLNLVLIIGLTSWTEVARLTRAEMLRIRSLEYIQSARSMGLKEWRIIFIHALPNAIAPAIITISFGIAGAILMESALSFLGIGVPPDIVTWGSLLAAGKDHFNAWWLVVFPGLAIFFTVTAFNLVGEGLRDAFDPRLRK